MPTPSGKPRGRPPMSCDKLDGKIQARKTPKGKNTLLTKCRGRNEHITKPCKVDKGNCIMKSSTMKCKDANMPRGSLSKGEQRQAITKRCNKVSVDTGLKCKVSQKTGKCGDATAAAYKRKNNLRTGKLLA